MATSKPVGIPATFKLTGGQVQIGTGPNGPVTVTIPAPAPAKPAPVKAAKAPKAPKPAPAPVAPAPAPAIAEGPGVPLLGTSGTKITIVLPPELATKIAKPVTGMGGWQRVLLELKAGTVLSQITNGAGDVIEVPILTLTPYLLDRLIVLAVKHGSGGYQAVIRWIVCLALDQNKSTLMGGK